jgi:hypothetical protein
MPRARRRTGKGSQTNSPGRDMRPEPSSGSRSDGKQDRDLIMVDPWSMLLEQLLEPTATDGDDEHGDQRGRKIGA